MNKMRSSILITTLILVCLCFDIIEALGDVGTAMAYAPPYLPTKCEGEDQNQFPSHGYFGAVSVGLWDNGGACGRKYQVRCLSGPNRPCNPGILIVVTIVDFCRTDPCPATMTLSNTAFNALSRSPDVKINVEYIQV